MVKNNGVEIRVGRSSTGVYHISRSSSATDCSSGNRGLRNRVLSDTDVKSAKHSMYDSWCTKCFPEGKDRVTITDND